MDSDDIFYERHLRKYVSLYFLISIIERELRKRVVTTLGDLAAGNGYREENFGLANQRDGRT